MSSLRPHATLALSYFLPSVSQDAPQAGILHLHSPLSWVPRIFLAILAFPVIYFVFGSMVAPFVVGFLPQRRLSSRPSANLKDHPGTVPAKLSLPLGLRSLLIPLGPLSRTPILALGLAHWYLVGLFGLIQITWMPPILRIAHSLEVGTDFFVYAAVLVLLFVPRHREPAVSIPAQVTPMFPS